MSAGHAAAVPVQVSATSHAPALTRQVTVFAAKASAGHVNAVPLQTSAVSQGPAAARQVVPAATGPADTQTAEPDEQSIVPRSHGLPVLHEAPCVQPATHMPAASQLPPAHVVPALA